MQKFENFQIAAYVYAYTLERLSDEEIRHGLDYFKQYIDLRKVYLENHRANTDISKEKMLHFKRLFEEYGLKVSSGITSTVLVDGVQKPAIFDNFCFSDPAHRKKYLAIVKDLAEVFDEIILDDYFFTDCRCDMCIEQKGTRSWSDFRLAQMEEFSHEIVELAHSVNPKCNFIIKYPNWYESFQETGYNPGKQKDIFDMIYTGTETRNPKYNNQHLQRYLSYSLVRWMENAAPGRNGGGWIDQGGSSDNLNIWLEQANLTMLAGAKELMLFNFEALIDSPALPPLGQQLYRLDRFMGQAGKPVGVSQYEPYDGDGEDQVVNYLGMGGIPFELTPEFDAQAPVVFLPESAAHDTQIMEKLEKYVRQGGHAIVTAGFFAAVYDKGIREMTSVRLTNRHVFGSEYIVDHYNDNDMHIAQGRQPIGLPVLSSKNNATWCDVSLIEDECNFPLLSEDYYGKGCLYILNLPDNFAHLYRLPAEVWRMIGKEMTYGLPVQLANEAKYNLFLYDNDCLALYSYRPFREDARLIVKGDAYKGVRDLETGETFAPYATLRGPSRRGDSATYNEEPAERVYHIPMAPGQYRFFELLK
ncbi:hypothetical protein [Luoshenia tenuis]|jgi:hypothetical protein|uniref:hypothetical protein n=1 Tax=Luoshenia tenuis TaxID=2763654 RepID=UPI003D89EDB0